MEMEKQPMCRFPAVLWDSCRPPKPYLIQSPLEQRDELVNVGCLARKTLELFNAVFAHNAR